MRISTTRCRLFAAAVPVLWLGIAAPALAAKPECALAITLTTNIADAGHRASTIQNQYVATDLVSNARMTAIDAARWAKSCGCPEAVPPLADASVAAARVNMDVNLVGVQQHAAQVKKYGDAALAALQKCVPK